MHSKAFILVILAAFSYNDITY